MNEYGLRFDQLQAMPKGTPIAFRYGGVEDFVRMYFSPAPGSNWRYQTAWSVGCGAGFSDRPVTPEELRNMRVCEECLK